MKLLASLRKKLKKNTYHQERKPTLPTDQELAFYLANIRRKFLESDIRALGPYMGIMSSFLSQQISTRDFQRRYLQAIKDESRDIPNKTFEVLSWLFVETDFYEIDERLRGPEDLDEEQLKQKVREALMRLNEIMGPAR